MTAPKEFLGLLIGGLGGLARRFADNITWTGSHTFESAITATGGVTGDLTGDVTGNVTGNVTGDLTGNVTGDLTGDVTGDLTGDVTGNVTAGNLSASGTVVFSALPTSDPSVAGQLWADNGVVTVSAGA